MDMREALAKGPQLGFGIMWPTSGVIERIGPDWDWIWLDGQHGQLDYRDVLAGVRAANLVDRPTVVRVPGHEPGYIGKTLDTGCEAVMVPVIDTPEQAKAAVEASRFPPLGSRSYGARRAVDLFGRGYSHQERTQPLLVCQIETQTGVENADAIAAVQGVDVLFFGPDDMAMRQGLAMDKPRPKGCFDKALKTVADAAKRHGKFAGGVFATPESLNEAVQLGYRLIVVGADASLLPAASAEKAQTMRNALGGQASKQAGAAGSPY